MVFQKNWGHCMRKGDDNNRVFLTNSVRNTILNVNLLNEETYFLFIS